MTFYLTVIIIILLVIIYEAKNPTWKKLSSKYSTDWKYMKWFGAETLYLWDTTNSSWFNQTNVDVRDEGLAIYFPFFKRYMPSVLIPWDDLEVQAKVYKGPIARLQIRSFARLQIRVVTAEVYLAINYVHKLNIDQTLNRKRQ